MRSSAAAITRTIPAPTGGWNAREPLPEMEDTDAVILDNFIPGTGGVSMRGGSSTFATGIGGPVNSLMAYNPPIGLARLFAASGGSIYDVTAGGAAGAAVVTGLGSDRWSFVNFGTPGGNFLAAVNGVDAPRLYNGTVWSTPAITTDTPNASGYTLVPSNLSSLWAFAKRLFATERNSLRAWFLPVGQIAGAAGCLDLASEFKLGGSLVAIADWTRDGGTGSNDYAVFISSMGEALVYAGTDPTNASAWSKVGLFRIPPPVGQRPVVRAGADLALVTSQGVLPLSAVLPLSLSQTGEVAITDKIKGAFSAAYQAAGPMFGWEIAEYPRGGLMLVNVPQPNGTFQQYVMNVLTQAWCRFVGLNAITWALLGDRLMFGTAVGTVVQYDVGAQDNGQPISGVVLPAFSAFKTTMRKRFTLARPLYTSVAGYSPQVALKVNYDTSVPAVTQGVVPSGGTRWGSPWRSPWGARRITSSRWQGIRGVGEVASVLLAVASNNAFILNHVDVTFEVGGVL